MERSEGWNNILDKKQVLVARNYIMNEIQISQALSRWKNRDAPCTGHVILYVLDI